MSLYENYEKVPTNEFLKSLNLICLDKKNQTNELLFSKLCLLDKAYFLVQNQNQNQNQNQDWSLIDQLPNNCHTQGVFNSPILNNSIVCKIPAFEGRDLGDSNFKAFHGTKYAYMCGSMAQKISGTNFVINAGKKGILASFGAGGVSLEEINNAITIISRELPTGPYAFNLLHNYHHPELEMKTVELYLNRGVTTIEASAFLEITLPLVLYRVKGLSCSMEENVINIKNKIIAKVSRAEIAEKFMSPAPPKIIKELLEKNLISTREAELAARIPMADDITVEADSGGHTDNRPLVCILPAIIALRNSKQAIYNYERKVRIGAAGGIGTPAAALSCFIMGASYVVTGSINLGSEALVSDKVKKLLCSASFSDMTMAPSADMFELGAKVQVLKRGTMYASRAQKLYDLYKKYDDINDIPLDERKKLEDQIFKASLSEIWSHTEKYFQLNNPSYIQLAEKSSKFKMALIFRWYLGQSSKWAINGTAGWEMDYQIWCGPALGAFNSSVRGTFLENLENRSLDNIARYIMEGAAFLQRINLLSSYLRVDGFNI